MKFSKCWYEKVCNELCDNCENTCIRYLEMKYLMDNSNVPKAKQMPVALTPFDCDLSAFRRLAEIKSNIVDFVEEGNSLYICSQFTGNGKTSWALKLMLRYFDQIWAGNGFRVRAVFVHTPTFLLKCKDFGNKDPEFEQLKRNLLTADLVVWDDISAVTPSAYDINQLLMYIDARVNADQSNIYTGNYKDVASLSQSIGTRLASRVLSTNTEVIEFNGGDQR